MESILDQKCIDQELYFPVNNMHINKEAAEWCKRLPMESMPKHILFFLSKSLSYKAQNILATVSGHPNFQHSKINVTRDI